MSVGTKYEVLVSKAVNINQNYPGHILTLSDRNIIKPEKIDLSSSLVISNSIKQ